MSLFSNFSCAGCPISYLISTADVLSSLQFVNGNPVSFVQDVVNFGTSFWARAPAGGNYFALTFSEQVLIDRIRVRGLQFYYVEDFSLLIQENATSTLNQFDRVRQCMFHVVLMIFVYKNGDICLTANVSDF